MIPIIAGAVIGYFIGGKKTAIMGALAGAGWNYASTGRLAGLSEDFDSEGTLDETQYGSFYPSSGGGGLPNLLTQAAGPTAILGTGPTPIPQYDGYSNYNSWYYNIYAPWLQAQSYNNQSNQPQVRCRKERNGNVVCVPVRNRRQRPVAVEDILSYYN
jgi:hypothetical protein